MFGYVRPVRDELKCKDFDRYRATYCGLCRTMRRRCGLLAPMVLNYDFTFLALLLAPVQGEEMVHCQRCHVPPFRRRCMCVQSSALEVVADESVILAYWQLRDKVRDEGFWPGLGARLICGLYWFCYRRAARRQPGFNHTVAQQLAALHRLEDENCPSLDQPADAFATLLRAAVPPSGDEAHDRTMAQLLYHLGRWIYLIDARDDLQQDRRKGNYNPIHLRFGDQPCDEDLTLTLNHSQRLICSACSLLDLGQQEGLVENVIYLGLPLVQRSVMDGSWDRLKKHRIWRNKE